MTPRLSSRLERNVFHAHGHRDSVDHFLERLWLQGLGWLAQRLLARVEDRVGVGRNLGLLPWDVREACRVDEWLTRVCNFDRKGSKSRQSISAWDCRLGVQKVSFRELDFDL